MTCTQCLLDYSVLYLGHIVCENGTAKCAEGKGVRDFSYCSVTLMSKRRQGLQFVPLHKVDFFCARTGRN